MWATALIWCRRVDTFAFFIIVVIDCNIRSGSHQALLVPIHKIETHMNVVRQCWIDAKAKHSLLESSLRETLEDLVYVHEKFDTISVFPDNLDVILEAKPAFDARHDMRVLMKPTKRRILNKLVGIRWLNDATPGGVIPTLKD